MALLYFFGLIFLWFLVWFIYNRYLKERKITDAGQILISIFFAFSTALVFHFYQDFLPILSPHLIIIVFIIFIFDIILRHFSWKFKFIWKFKSKKTLYLTSTLFNILFQQAVLNAAIRYLSLLLPVSTSILIFTILFGLVHSPLLFMRHVADREIDVGGAFILGLISSYLILSFPMGYIYSFLIHYGFYVIYSMRIDNEARI